MSNRYVVPQYIPQVGDSVAARRKIKSTIYPNVIVWFVMTVNLLKQRRGGWLCWYLIISVRPTGV